MFVPPPPPPARRDKVPHPGSSIAWGRWAITCNDPDFRGQGAPDSGEDYGPAPGGWEGGRVAELRLCRCGQIDLGGRATQIGPRLNLVSVALASTLFLLQIWTTRTPQCGMASSTGSTGCTPTWGLRAGALILSRCGSLAGGTDGTRSSRGAGQAARWQHHAAPGAAGPALLDPFA